MKWATLGVALFLVLVVLDSFVFHSGGHLSQGKVTKTADNHDRTTTEESKPDNTTRTEDDKSSHGPPPIQPNELDLRLLVRLGGFLRGYYTERWTDTVAVRRHRVADFASPRTVAGLNLGADRGSSQYASFREEKCVRVAKVLKERLVVVSASATYALFFSPVVVSTYCGTGEKTRKVSEVNQIPSSVWRFQQDKWMLQAFDPEGR